MMMEWTRTECSWFKANQNKKNNQNQIQENTIQKQSKTNQKTIQNKSKNNQNQTTEHLTHYCKLHTFSIDHSNLMSIQDDNHH